MTLHQGALALAVWVILGLVALLGWVALVLRGQCKHLAVELNITRVAALAQPAELAELEQVKTDRAELEQDNGQLLTAHIEVLARALILKRRLAETEQRLGVAVDSAPAVRHALVRLVRLLRVYLAGGNALDLASLHTAVLAAETALAEPAHARPQASSVLP